MLTHSFSDQIADCPKIHRERKRERRLDKITGSQRKRAKYAPVEQWAIHTHKEEEKVCDLSEQIDKWRSVTGDSARSKGKGVKKSSRGSGS